MKYFIWIMFLLFPALVLAQNTTVTGTFQDPNGQTLNNGTYKISFVPVPGLQGPYTQNGVAFTQSYTGSLSSSGTMSVGIPDNTTIQPGGSQWAFSMCPLASTQCSPQYVTTITGSIQSITTGMNALIPVIVVNTNFVYPFAYTDAEVTPAKNGVGYFNSTLNALRMYNQGIWIALGGSTGGGTTTGSGVPSNPCTTQGTLYVDITTNLMYYCPSNSGTWAATGGTPVLAAGATTAVQNNAGAGVFGDSGCTATGGAITCPSGVSAGPVAHLATYGACNTTTTAYTFAGIDDGTTNVIGATVSGGGSIKESVFCNNTAWTCAAGCTAPSGSFTAGGDLSGNATSQNVINAHWTVHATVTTSPYTVAATDYLIPCDATSGTIVLNLPAATGSGKPYSFKKLDASANACAITPNGTDTIDTVNAAQNITTQYAVQALVDSASGKWIRGQIIAMSGAITGASNNTLIAVGTLPNGMTATTQSPGDNTTSVATDAFVLANAATSTVQYAVGGGTADAQTVALSTAWTSYVAGACVKWAPAANNLTSAPTLSVNGLAPLPVVRVGGGTLGVNDISTTQVPAIACLDGTAANFQLQNPSPSGVINVVHTGLAVGNAQTINTVLADDSFTPSVDGTFMLVGSVTQTGAATGCSTQGAVKFVMSGVDVDSNYTYPQNTLQGWLVGLVGQAGTFTSSFTFTASVTQPGSSQSIVASVKRWKAGTAVHVALLVATQPVGCTGSHTVMYRVQLTKVQ